MSKRVRGEGGTSSTASTPRQPSKKHRSRRLEALVVSSPVPLAQPSPVPVALDQTAAPTDISNRPRSARMSLDFSSEPIDFNEVG